MPRPPLPEATRKGRLVGVRFTGPQFDRLAALGVDRSNTMRTLFGEALSARRAQCRVNRSHLGKTGRCARCGVEMDGKP